MKNKNLKKLFTIAVVVIATNFVFGCISKEPEALKSPCVGAKGSPCDKRPANPEMFKV